MPRFIVEALYDGDTEPVSFGCELALDDQTFMTQMLDLGETLYTTNNTLASIKTITAAEQVTDEVGEGDVVWRDWSDCDLTTAESRKATIALVLGSKALWRDRGTDFDILSEILCPEDWEVKEYGLTAEDGYVIPG